MTPKHKKHVDILLFLESGSVVRRGRQNKSKGNPSPWGNQRFGENSADTEMISLHAEQSQNIFNTESIHQFVQ